MRKVFHLLICVVYLLGLYYDRSLLFLCSYGMLIVLVLAETIRYQKIGWLGERIQDLQALFIDEKDLRSELVLSHVYLLIGFSVPIWISDFGQFNLAQLSGLLTVGVGDSFASLIGSRYGRHRLPGSSKKSLEGSLGLVFSMLLVLLALAGLGFFDPFRLKSVLLVLGLLGFTAFTEAYTNDNDNLVLSIVAYPFLNSLHT
jgi:dolichol kinase